ncbi:MAG: hypothetical protein E2O62_02840 [Gammaproteobacteria bacterium]|nr:MAG: hypothetical protein E2O62_02840 [Gammaproteobacteria bacterium]
MAYRVRKVNYCKMTVSSRAGQAEKVLRVIEEAGIDMYAFSGFPTKAGKSQVDFVSDDTAAIKRLAKKSSWRLSNTKKAFLVQGNDQIGAIHKIFKKLADEKINVTAADAVAASGGRYGMILWVKPKVYNRAARVLKAK